MTFLPVSKALSGANDPQDDSRATYVPEVSLARGASGDHTDPSFETFIAQPLRAGRGEQEFNAIAFLPGGSPKTRSIGAAEELTPTLGSADNGSTRTPAVAYRKATKVHGPDDAERWEEDEVTNTLDAGGQEARLGEAVVFTERSRRDGRTLETQSELAYALTNPGSGGRTHSRQLMDASMSVRRLTPTECERLQGFPDGWTQGLSDSARYRMLGNAVCVPVAAWLARRIVSVDGQCAAEHPTIRSAERL